MGHDNPREVNSLIERYYSILKNLEFDFPFIIKQVYNLGKPSFSGLCSTSCVGVDELSQDLFYDWNVDFFNKLKDEEIGFVVLHETLHVILDHIGKTSKFLDQGVWNIACDIIINDWLNVEFIGRQRITNIAAPRKLITGMKVFNRNITLREYSAEKVYSIIIEKKSFSMGSFNNIDSHENWSDIQPDVIKKINESIAKSSEIKEAVGRGLLPGNCIESAYEIKNKFNLKKFIKNIIATKTEENYHENWRRYNIKLSTVYPKVILPYITMNENKGKLSLLFAIDVSGSMSKKLISEMIAIVKNHELDHNVTAIQFDVKVHPLDLNKRGLLGRGGTSFNSVVNYIKKSDENYDAIIVLTDGYGGTINVKDIEPYKWFWGLTTSCKIPDTYGTIFRIPPEYMK